MISGMCARVWRNVYSLLPTFRQWERQMSYLYVPRPPLACTYLLPMQYLVAQPPEVYYQPPPQGYVYQPPPVGYVYQPPPQMCLVQPPGQFYYYQPPTVRIQ